MQVVVTGANRGIGAALLRAFDARGDDAVGTARKPKDGLAALDVTNPASVRALAAALEGRPIDLLVCNAGVYLDGDQALATGYPAELWAATFSANVTGVFLTVQAFLPNLRAAKGKIAIISSNMASDTRAPGGSYIYRASKAAALNLGRNLASDLRGEGIAVGIYHPGWVQTDMGGKSAEISADASAAGLIARFDALSPATTGVFEDWRGKALAF